MLKSITLLSMFILVSLWEYCMYFYRNKLLPYAMGFNILSLIQWIIILCGVIKIFGFVVGLVAFGCCFFILQYVTHFTLGIIYNFIFKNNPLPALAFFFCNGMDYRHIDYNYNNN